MTKWLASTALVLTLALPSPSIMVFGLLGVLPGAAAGAGAGRFVD